MSTGPTNSVRVFKASHFAKAAKMARIRDDELCAAIEQVRLGQAVDLGGGVYKKRLDKNERRSIILARGGRYWIFQYLFAKRTRNNIDERELSMFRMLAKAYAALSEREVGMYLQNKTFEEICHGQ